MAYLTESDYCYCVIGRPGSGKSNLVKNIIHKTAKDYNNIIVICPSGGYDYLPSNYVYKFYNVELLKKLKKLHETNKDVKTLLILDDIYGLVNFNNNPLFNSLLANFRHLHINIIIVAQYFKQISRPMRSMIRRVFIFKNQDFETCRDIAREFAGGSKIYMKYIIDTIPTLKEHTCLCIYPDGDESSLFSIIKAPNMTKKIFKVEK